MQDVVEATERMSCFNGQDIVRLFYDADLRSFAVRIAAVKAKIAIADVVALRADAELVFYVENRLREVLGVLPRGTQKMKGDALRRLLTNAGQSFAFLNEPRKRLGELRHLF